MPLWLWRLAMMGITIVTGLEYMEVRCGAALIQSGFNDASGINSDGTSHSPFNTGNLSLNGQGTGESGWAGPWSMSVGSAIVNSATTYEGDGAAAFFQNTAAADRTLAVAPTAPFSIDFRLMVPSVITRDVIFRLYDSGIANITSAIAVQLQVETDNQFRVLDGIEDSAGTGVATEATGLYLTPGTWHDVGVIVDPITRTWDFYLDGVHYNAPDPLGFRGVPVNLNSIQFLNEIASPAGSYIDAVTINTDLAPPPIPEPSISVMLALGLLSFAGRCTLKLRDQT